MPTVVATRRWPCSQNRLPTIFGKTCPFESGQSGVASPASLLVTSAPAIIKKNVAQATKIAKRLRPRFIIANCRTANCQLPSEAIGNWQSKIVLVFAQHREFDRGHHLQRGLG